MTRYTAVPRFHDAWSYCVERARLRVTDRQHRRDPLGDQLVGLRQQVGVGLQDLLGSVAEAGADDVDRYARRERQCRCRVAECVQRPTGILAALRWALNRSESRWG